MALTHQSLLREPTCTFLHLPQESFLPQSHFPDLFHALPEAVPSAGISAVLWDDPHWNHASGSDLVDHASVAFGAAAAPSNPPIAGGILLEEKWLEGNRFVLTATSVSCPELPPATGSTMHTIPHRRAPVLGTPSPHEGSVTPLSPLAEQE